MPSVKAIERGREQTESPVEMLGRCGVWTHLLLNWPIRNRLERLAIEGDSPVEEGQKEDF